MTTNERVKQLQDLTRVGPVQEIRNLLYETLEARLDTYDYKPGAVPYPFAYIGEQVNVDEALKKVVWGRVNTTIHFFHTAMRRADLMALLTLCINDIRSQRHTEHFYISIRDVSYRAIDESDNGTDIVHAVLDVDIEFQ